MKTRTNFLRRVYTLAILLSVFVSISCQYNLLIPPTIEPPKDKEASEYGDVISVPTQMNASHGKYRSVELRWEPIINATQYQIYAASTPYDEFTQVAETKKSETTITLTENSGISKYYAVKAVNYYGTVSGLSPMAPGSTLAVPVITSIDSTDNGTTSTVTWWMENCTESTYQKLVQYIVTCYGSDGSTVIKTENANGEATSVVFHDLIPNTNYFYQVEAFLTTDQDNTEKSEMLDAETARRLIPNAPEAVTASTGDSTSEILVSWKLPDFVDYTIAAKTYAPHPVYFTVERKLATQPDSAYTKIIAYAGTIRDDDNTSTDANIKFSCNPSAATPSSSTNLTVTSAGEAPNANYEDYIPGSTITYKDSTGLERGKQYSYRIRSYVDDTSRTISSDSAVVTTTGWLITIPSFQATGNYTMTADESAYTNITANFNLSFETFGNDNYAYFITETRTKIDGTVESEKQIYTGTSCSGVTSHSKPFNDPGNTDQKGYYSYKLYICPSGSGNYSSPLITLTSLGSITVTDNPADIPSIDNLSIADGFSDHYELTWDYNEHCGYRLKWKSYVNGIEQAEESFDIDTSDTNVCTITPGSPSTITVKHPATSGDERKYVVVAVSGANKETQPSSMMQTLGTAAVEIDSWEYDSIKVRWRDVQKATSYTVSAYYEDDPSFTELVQTINNNNPGYGQAGTKTIEEKNYQTFTISLPDGYNDVTRSGKPIKLKVVSNNSATSNQTTGEKQVYTLGPAMVKAAIDDERTANTTIGIKWNKVEGASGYYIYRTKYKYDDFTQIERTDSYFFDNSDNKLKLNGEEVDHNRAITSVTDTQIFLSDMYYADDSNGTNSYRTNQADICMGTPYGYVILPVKNQNDVQFDSNTLTFSSSSTAKFSNVSDLKNASYGYGIKLYASKATSGDTQTLSWTAPYNSTGHSATVYRRPAGSNSDWYKLSTTLTSGTEVTFQVPKEERENAYEYTVKYQKGASLSYFTMEQSMINKLASVSENSSLYNVGVTPEQANKGYLMYVPFTAKTGATSSTTLSNPDYFSEILSWNNWDYNVRKIGPKSAKIYIYNKNLSSTWQVVKELDESCICNSNTTPLSDITLEHTSSTLKLKPTAISNAANDKGTTNGYLKVLRDARHYYKLELKKDESTIIYIGGLTEGTPKSSDDLIYAYRNVTKEELAKSALLQISYAFYKVQGGKPDYTNIANNRFHYSSGTIDSDYRNISGNAKFENMEMIGLTGKYKATFKLSNYVQGMQCPDNNSSAFLKLTTLTETPSVRIKGLSDNYVDMFRTDGGINVQISSVDTIPNNDNETLPPSYTATMNFNCTDDKNLTVKIGADQICSVSTADDRRKWFPMQIYGDTQYWLNSTTYGWWPQ